MPYPHGWLTPESLPSGTRCIQLNVPDDFDFFAMLKGAIVPLFDSDQYEEHGTLTPEECAQYWIDWDAANSWGGCEVSGFIVGEIRMLPLLTAPDNWLLCDGSAKYKLSYMPLYGAIGGTFGEVGDYFYLPDLRGRVPLGTGSGTGLTPRSLADQGGEETHVLIDAEMPAHDHTINHNHTGNRSFITFAQGSSAGADLLRTTAGTAGVTAAHSGSSGQAGSDDPHENMPPYLGMDFYIYAGSMTPP